MRALRSALGAKVMTRVSASAVPRLLACPGSAHLRQSEYHTEYADDGNERHEDAETAADTGGELDPRVKALLQPGDELATECSFAYDVSDDTGRPLGHLARRDYQELRPFEIPGTIDLLIRGNGRLIVVDYKSFEDVDPAASNAQVATYALMVARATGIDEVTVAVVYLAAPWRPADVATLYAFDLDAHADRLHQLMTGIDRTLRTGKQCKYCPAFHDCPEQRALAVGATEGALSVRVESMIPFEQDDDALQAYELFQRLKVMVQRLSAGLYARAAERPIPLGNGKVFGRVSKQGNEKLDGDTVWQVVKEMHPGLEDKAVERKATKKRLEETLKGKRGAMGKVLEAVRERGGAERKAGYEFVEYEPGLRLLPEESQ